MSRQDWNDYVEVDQYDEDLALEEYEAALAKEGQGIDAAVERVAELGGCPGPGGLLVPEPCSLWYGHGGDHLPKRER